MKSSAPILPDGMIVLRGLKFPANMIKTVMRETGGTVVSDDRINEALDRAMNYHLAMKGGIPQHLIVEAIPATTFIPKRISVRRSRFEASGKLTKMFLYFAKPRIFHA